MLHSVSVSLGCVCGVCVCVSFACCGGGVEPYGGVIEEFWSETVRYVILPFPFVLPLIYLLGLVLQKKKKKSTIIYSELLPQDPVEAASF